MSLSRIIHKTPLVNEKSNIYEIDNIDSQLINSILSDRFIGEGVYCIEQYSIDDYKEQYLSTPSFSKYQYPVSDKIWDFQSEMKDIEIFELTLDKPSFMPLDVKSFAEIFNIHFNSPMFIQVLICKRTDIHVKENMINAYQSFLKGNDHPFDNSVNLKIQEKVLSIFNKLGNFTVKREQIEEMEQKIISDIYRFECRIITFNTKTNEKVLSKFRKGLKGIQLFNELKIQESLGKKGLIRLIKQREFKVESSNQLLSEQEIYSLLCSETLTTTPKIEIIPHIKHKNIGKLLETNTISRQIMSILPQVQHVNREIDETKAEQVNNALKRVSIVKNPLKVNEIHQGASLQKIQLVVPPEITYTSIQKKLVDIQGALGNENVSIEIGDKPDTINVYVPLEKRDVIYFRYILESAEFIEFKNNNPLPFIIGENANGGYLFGDLTQIRHLLIAGTTGSGKSVFLVIVLLCFIICVPPQDVDIYLIDPKMNELSLLDGFPQVKKVITDMKKANGLLHSLCEEMDRRYELLASVKARNIQIYNQNQSEKLPYIICAVDELADLMMVNNDVEDYIVRLGQKARAAGIHLLLATQRPSVDVVTGLIKANMPNRVAFSVTSQVDSRTILDKGGAEKLLGKGDGLIKIEGNSKEFERFQSPVLTLDSNEEIQILENLKELFENVTITHNEISVQEKEEPISQIKRIIANTGETRISELQKLVGIRINIISDLIKELVDEGWLEKQGRSYEIVASEDELNKWRDNDE